MPPCLTHFTRSLTETDEGISSTETPSVQRLVARPSACRAALPGKSLALTHSLLLLLLLPPRAPSAPPLLTYRRRRLVARFFKGSKFNFLTETGKEERRGGRGKERSH